jgi:hypothetical protein
MRTLQKIFGRALLATFITASSIPVAMAGNLYSDANRPVNSIVPDAIKQGSIGDCYFLAAVGSLAKIDPQAIQDMIKENGDGTYTVTFPGAPNEPITVAAPTDSELKKFAHDSCCYGTWVPVLEKAYGTYCQKHWWRRTVFNLGGGDAPSEGADGGSYFHSGLSIITPGGVSTDSTTFSRYSTLSTHIKKALDEKRPVTVSTSAFNNRFELPTKHEYSVLAFTPNHDDPSKGIVTIYNPWGDSEDAGLYGSTRATFQMSLNNLCKTFCDVAYADQPVPKTPETVDAQGASNGDVGTVGDGLAATALPPSPPYVSNIQNDEGYSPLLKSQIGSQVIAEDSTRTTVLTDGTIIIENPNGYKHFKFPDGNEYENIPGVSEKWTRPDGTQTIRYPDKTEVSIFPDGNTVITKPDGTKITELRTGTIITQNPDGTTTKENPRHSTSMVNPISPINLLEKLWAQVNIEGLDPSTLPCRETIRVYDQSPQALAHFGFCPAPNCYSINMGNVMVPNMGARQSMGTCRGMQQVWRR